ncbi:MAG: pyridoxamine 5'-phosphate oxidase family protein [Paludibacter sp.]|jgi:uncharacterized pyridoxamine 5'-phosphate oxidase family protein|nr:pyridoxamine 5'-phosphate oxidase family protein [Paludibacter sp.]
MKKLFFSIIAVSIAFSALAGDQNSQLLTQNQQNEMKEVHDFIRKCSYYFLATTDADQPRVRPFGTIAIYDGKLYIQTGKRKNVSQQMIANPKIEICAYDQSSGEWVRIQAIATPDDRREVKQFMLEQYPSLKAMYSPDDDNTFVLALTSVTATFYSFAGEPKVYEF